MNDLPPWRRAEIETIQSALEPRYRSTLEYTYGTDGAFVVVLQALHGGRFPLNLASCATPDAGYGDHCFHECRGVFMEQSWEKGVLSVEQHQCLDASPVWLTPHGPLPNLSRYPFAGNDDPAPDSTNLQRASAGSERVIATARV